MISVVVADDEMISRGYIELAIKPSKDYEVAASLSSASEALDYLRKNGPPGLLILDVMMRTGIDGLTAARLVKEQYPQVKIIIVTSMADADWIGKALDIGVEAFWFKTYPEMSLLEVMERVMAGEIIYPGRVPHLNLGDLPAGELTARQRELLRLMVDGLTNREIAEAMGLSPNTVKEYIDTLMWKTGLRSRTALAARASRLAVVVSENDRLNGGAPDG